MKIFKIAGLVFLILTGLVVLLLGASTVYHKSQLAKETRDYLPGESLVEVNGKMMHVMTAGEGEETLVFLSGHGTPSPTLDFKPLWVRMKDDYRIAVVERSGYGWSDASNTPRDVDNILEETRKALQLAGENGPYVLFPHSMSGLEAIYWAQKYPDEVLAIIGLDPLTPGAAEILPAPDQNQLAVMYLVSRTGMNRFMPEADLEINFPLLKTDELTDEEKRRYTAAFYRSSLTKDMLREVKFLEDNFAAVAEMDLPTDIPMYFFISTGQEVAVDGWMEALIEYISQVDKGKYMQLDTGHYLHHQQADLIAEESSNFLNELE
jgi:pimeloyl-ACP methyl ester carboxylesterase